MYAAAVETGAGLVVQYGLPVLLVAFALEGALVGKLVPTRALFVAAVLAVGTDVVGVVGVAAAAVAGATVGQFVLFAVVRYTDLAPAAIPLASDESGAVGEGGRVAEWFDRWGLSAVALSNTLPVARGSLTVPAAMAGTPALRFSASSLLGSSVYACGLLAIAAGIDAIVALP